MAERWERALYDPGVEVGGLLAQAIPQIGTRTEVSRQPAHLQFSIIGEMVGHEADHDHLGVGIGAGKVGLVEIVPITHRRSDRSDFSHVAERGRRLCEFLCEEILIEAELEERVAIGKNARLVRVFHLTNQFGKGVNVSAIGVEGGRHHARGYLECDHRERDGHEDLPLAPSKTGNR